MYANQIDFNSRQQAAASLAFVAYLRFDMSPSVSASGLQYTTAFPGYVALEFGTSTMSDNRVYWPEAFWSSANSSDSCKSANTYLDILRLYFSNLVRSRWR